MVANGRAKTVMAVGMAAWTAIAIAAGIGWYRLGVIETLLLLAIWVIVPTGMQLIPIVGSRVQTVVRKPSLLFAVAASATISFGLTTGSRAAGFLAVPWLILCLAIAREGALRFFRMRASSFVQFCFAVGEGYLAVGGGWLVFSRLGIHTAGFEEPIVLLTSVHFHFAGFLTALLAGLAFEELSHTSHSTLLRTVALGAIAGPGLLGLAFLAGPKFKLAAVSLIVAGQCAVALSMAKIALSQTLGFRGALLMEAGAAIVVGMLFAGTWAIGEFPLRRLVDLQRMERIHGALNAIGFGLMGLMAFVFRKAH